MINLRAALRTAAAAAVLTAQAPANAETFTIFIYETREDLALRQAAGDDGRAYWADYAAFANILQTAHALRAGAPLALPQDSVSYSRTGRRVGGDTDAPVSLSGYFQIEVDTLAAAEALAAQAPSARRGGRVEVRASYTAPLMSPPSPVAH